MSRAKRGGRGPLLAAVGALIAAVSAACGIGGGVFGVPILHYLFGMSLTRSVATTLVLVTASAGAATLTEAFHPERALFWGAAAVLAVAALLGTQLGFWIARRITTRWLKLLFCVLLAAVGVRLMLRDPGGPPVPGYVLSAADLWVAAGIGLLAGVVVPLLGVGGGLVVVPALLLFVPEVGYLGARATALAMATVTSLRSAWIYSREGAVEWAAARWFGGGALAGAAAGVWIVHLPSMAEVGQVLLAWVLCLASVRFGLDVARAGGRVPAEAGASPSLDERRSAVSVGSPPEPRAR